MRRFHIRAGGVLLLALLYFVLDTSDFAALILAAAAHELGHAAAIWLTGGSIVGVTANATGAVITRTAPSSRAGEIFCAASGPLAGALWALLASAIGKRLGSDMLLVSSGFSAVLSVFNSMPALPLDGGRVIACILPERAAALVSLLTASAMLLFGVISAVSGLGLAALVASAAVMCAQARQGQTL